MIRVSARDTFIIINLYGVLKLTWKRVYYLSSTFQGCTCMPLFPLDPILSKKPSYITPPCNCSSSNITLSSPSLHPYPSLPSFSLSPYLPTIIQGSCVFSFNIHRDETSILSPSNQCNMHQMQIQRINHYPRSSCHLNLLMQR